MSDFQIQAFCEQVLMPRLAGIEGRLGAIEEKGQHVERLAKLLDIALDAKDRENANELAIEELRAEIVLIKRRIGMSSPPSNGEVATGT